MVAAEEGRVDSPEPVTDEDWTLAAAGDFDFAGRAWGGSGGSGLLGGGPGHGI